MNRIPLFLLPLSLLLCRCASTDPAGPDESQKTRLAEAASRWAQMFNKQQWDDLSGLYAPQVDFNGRPLSGEAAAGTIRAFMNKDNSFRLKFEEGSWVLDSMRGRIYAGHVIGEASHAYQDSITVPTKVDLWMRLEGDQSPQIVAQFDEIGGAYNAVMQRYRDMTLAGQDFDSLGRPNYTFWEEAIKVVSPTVGRVRYYGKHEGRRFFYATDKESNKLMGVVDEHGKVIVPFGYDDIGNFGLLAPDVAEVSRDGKKGLVHFDGREVAAPSFDAILPHFGDPGIAFWGLKGSQWSTYDSLARPAIPEQGSPGLDWAHYLREMPIEAWRAAATPLADVDHSLEAGYAYMYYYGIFRVPFALAERHVLEDMHSGGMEMGEDSRSISIDSVFMTADGRVQMITTVETWGIGGRESYHDLDHQWVVFEPEMTDTAQAVHLYTTNLDEGCRNGRMRIIGDTMMEAVQNTTLLGYWQMPGYVYYRILPEGGVAQMLPEREFPFMSLVPMDKDFLSGCFHSHANDEEAEAYKSTADMTEEERQYAPVMRTAMHFRAEDLDYLVNEVYAWHGKAFEKPKWQEYYKGKSWYVAEMSDVEGDLSALEKQNIALVRSIQKQMKGKESAYTQERFEEGDYY